jgi:hypothetical protein
MRITLPGLCGLIVLTGLLKVGLDHLRLAEKSPPGPVPRAPTSPPPASNHSASEGSGLSPDEEAARREWAKRIGSLRLVKRNEPQWGPEDEDSDETVIVQDSQGRTVARVAGHWVDVELVRDLTGDGIPEVVLRTWSGGAHGSFVYYIYSAGERPRCLLAYYKGNDEDDPAHWPNFEIRDLDSEGRQEIVTCYDGFAYWCEVPEWETCYAGSARVPMVLGLRRGRYVDVTRSYRAWLRQKLAQAKQHLMTDLAVVGSDQEPGVGTFRQGLIEYYSVALLLHSRRTARQMVLRLLPEWDRRVFRKNGSLIEKVLDARRKRLAYPPVYAPGERSQDADFLARMPDVLR